MVIKLITNNNTRRNNRGNRPNGFKPSIHAINYRTK